MYAMMSGLTLVPVVLVDFLWTVEELQVCMCLRC